ncbi:MAG: preprotein translocase subunit SecY, partial [Candidatus Omnitrophica bacterium]|nr:preprotein translocase subunit SecY [Candidatus Omnitrophota bacterium]
MIKALANSLKIPDLRRKLFITFGLLSVYRIGAYIPTPGVNGAALVQFFDSVTRSQGGTLFGIMNMFSGGALTRLTIFALGIMPYISASIILQLLI